MIFVEYGLTFCYIGMLSVGMVRANIMNLLYLVFLGLCILIELLYNNEKKSS